MLEIALKWWRMGVVPVPLVVKSKRPKIPWLKLSQTMPPQALVRSWDWSGNLGLICGPVSGNLVVLDFDEMPAYYRWIKTVRPEFLETYQVQTGRGFHVYYRVEDMPCQTYSMGIGEVKASGYVVAPPSIHPSGAVYRPVEPVHDILGIESLTEIGLAMPGEIQHPLVRPQPDASFLPRDGAGVVSEIKRAYLLTVYLGRITEVVPSSPDGVWLMCRCPFHDDRSPSMWVNARWQVCRCFKPGCEGNVRVLDVINVHALRRGISNDHAIQELAAELGL